MFLGGGRWDSLVPTDDGVVDGASTGDVGEYLETGADCCSTTVVDTLIDKRVDPIQKVFWDPNCDLLGRHTVKHTSMGCTNEPLPGGRGQDHGVDRHSSLVNGGRLPGEVGDHGAPGVRAGFELVEDRPEVRHGSS